MDDSVNVVAPPTLEPSAPLSNDPTPQATRSMRRPRSLTPPKTKRKPTPLDQFRQVLLNKAPSYAVAWRKIVDPLQRGFITFSEFCTACRRVYFHGDKNRVWQQLDPINKGTATLVDLDHKTAIDLGSFYRLLQRHHGNIDAAAMHLGFHPGRRFRRQEFCSLAVLGRLARKSEADDLFDMLADATMSQALAKSEVNATVSRDAFEWLQRIGHTLLAPPDERAKPGVIGGSSARRSFCSQETGCFGNDDDLISLESGGCSDHERGPSAIFQDLYSAAVEWHERRNMKEAAALRPPENKSSRSFDYAHTVRLHDDIYRRKLAAEARADAKVKELCLIDENKGKKSDRRAFARLCKPRRKFEQKSQLPEKKPVPEGFDPDAAGERMYMAGVRKEKRLEDKRQQLQKEEEQERLERLGGEEKLKRRVFAKDSNKRVYDKQFATWQGQKDRHRQMFAEQLKETEFELPQDEGKVKPRPSTFLRKHQVYYAVANKLAEARRRKSANEKEYLEEKSVHKKSKDHDGEVWERLHTSYNRHLPPDPIDKELSDEDWNAQTRGQGFWEPQAEPGNSPLRQPTGGASELLP